MSGKIILVGAGPGGKGLLTLRGLEALGEAEPLAFDDRGRLLPGQYGHE